MSTEKAMSTLPERLQRAAETTWGSPTLRALLSEAAQSLQAQEVVKETTINHARDPHCCGCYVIRWNDGDPVAVCGECGLQVALLDRLVSGAPEGGGIDEGMMIRACTAYNEVIPLSGFDSQRPLAMRAALTAALQAPTP